MKYKLPKKVNKIVLNVISPSGYPFKHESNKDLYNNALKNIEKEKFGIIYSSNWDKDISNELEKFNNRKLDLIQAYKSNGNIIITSVGGYDADKLIDMDLLNLANKSDKWLTGMSDITSIINALAFYKGIISVYGVDLFWGFGKFTTDNFLDSFISLVTKGDLKKLEQFAFTLIQNPNELKVIEGRIMGGCLSSFCNLLNSKFNPLAVINEPFIFVIEDIATNSNTIIKQLNQIKSTITFKKYCRGLIIGNFLMSNNQEVIDVVKGTIQNLPIFFSKYIGHGVSNMPLPIGALLEIDLSKNKVIKSKYKV